ncbi:MAG TPA: methionine synthase [Candidatus Latescibacteria bacterium]|nr:methionine synthase [Candidatus Latescibacterota bacterium]
MDLLRRLKEQVLIFDGAMGTMLQAYGLSSGDCPEEWNVTHADIVRSIHQGYLEAGSDVIETNTFGGNRFKLAKSQMQDRVIELNTRGAELARELAGPDHYVAGSVGPTGELLKPLGRVSPREMYEVFAEQITALEEGGADLICIETMSDLEEARIAIKAARENTKLPVIATMLFEPGLRGFRTMMGTDIRRAVNGLLEGGANVIGTNCGRGIEEAIGIVQEMRAVTDAPILVQPNAGVPQLQGGRTVFPQTPEFMASLAPELVRAGANLVGGCCGTTPAHIRAMIKAVRGCRR